MKMKPLTEFCALNMGQSPSSETYNDENVGLPFFQGNADFGEVHPKVRIWCSSPVKVAAAGDILISVRAPIGAMNIANTPCCIGRGLAALSPNPGTCVQEYLYYALQSRIDSLIAQGTGSTFKAIGKKTLEDTQIPAYSLDEQQIISDTLSETDQLITKTKAQVSLLDQLVKSRFVEMFGAIPESEFVTMESVCSLITDGTHQPPKFVDNGIPFLFVSNITTNELTYDADKFISSETYADLMKRTPVEIGDILLSTVGSYGHPAVVKSDRKFSFQRHIAFLKPRRDVINSIYLHGVILTSDIQRQIDARVKGIAQKTLNLSEVRTLRFPLPPMKEQNRFAAFVAEVDKSKFRIQKSLSIGRKLWTMVRIDAIMNMDFSTQRSL